MRFYFPACCALLSVLVLILMPSDVVPAEGRSVDAHVAEPEKFHESGDDRPSARTTDVLETANFRIHHGDPEVAARAARVLEDCREKSMTVWDPKESDQVWAPRCDVMLQSPAPLDGLEGECRASGSFAVVTCESGRVIGRMIVAPEGDTRLLESILPHEVTHIVVRSRLRSDAVPCWLDEGVALLSDSTRRREDLRAATVSSGASVKSVAWAEVLNARRYPLSGEHQQFYARSLAMCECLLLLGDAEDLMQFAKMAISDGAYDRALRRYYSIPTIEEFDGRLTDYVTTQMRSPARLKVSSQIDASGDLICR